MRKKYLSVRDTKTCDLMRHMNAWTGTLEKVFPTRATEDKEEGERQIFIMQILFMYANIKWTRPTVFIPVFPGTNCEYDSAKAFERAGADTIVKVFKNLNAEDIRESVDEFDQGNRPGTDHHVPGWILRR